MFSNSHRLFGGATAMAMALMASPLAAQQAPDAGQASVGERFESVTGARPSTRDGLAALVTGYEDVILLERRRFFTASATLSPQYTSNAALTPDDEGDYLVVANLGLRAATTLAEKVDVYASLGTIGARYSDFDELDYTALTAGLGAERAFITPMGQLALGASYAPALIYDKRYNDRQQTRHRLETSAQLYSPLGGFGPWKESDFARNAGLVTTLVAERVLTDPEEYEYSAASLDVALVWRPAGAWQFGAGVGAYLRDYDDYFEGIVGDSRRDDGLRASVYAQWLPAPWLSVSLGADWVDNNSSSDVNEYNAESFSPGATFSARF
jgi:hypothetical protein